MIAVYCITRDRLEITRQSLKMLRQWAGCDFTLYVVDNGSRRDTVEYLRREHEEGRIYWLHLAGENLGQNIAANLALDEMSTMAPEWVLRWDPDALPRTRRFLRKLVRRAEAFRRVGVDGVFSPVITKLENPPEAFMRGDDVGFEYEVVRILGGICRLHPASFFDTFRFNKFGALGLGEAAEIATECLNRNTPKIRVMGIEVEHAYGSKGQAEMWPDENTWERREVGRYVGYGL